MAKGFTLIEMIIVVVIVSVLVAVSVPSYTTTREKALDREAVGILRLIRSANKQYLSKSNAYYPYTGLVSSVSSINGNLSIFISTNFWTISLWGNGNVFRANATRGNRYWTINESAPDPLCYGAGCLP